MSICAVILLMISGFVLVYRYLHDREINYPTSLLSDFDEIVYYKITPETIRSDINKGGIGIFQILAIEPDVSKVGEFGDAFWSQSDYLQVANALRQFVWGENIYDWRISGMSFGRNCHDNISGFESGDVTYYKQIEKSNAYLAYYVRISPESGQIISGEGGFRRPLFGWASVHPDKFKVNAEDAVQIAEENGGREFRKAVSNSCSIVVALNPNPVDNGWLVAYFSNNGAVNYIININPYTGSYKISKPH